MAVLNDILQVKYFCFLDNQLGINVRHYKVTLVSGTGASDDQVAEYLDDVAHTYYPPLVSSGGSYYGCSVQRILPTVDTLIHTSAAHSTAGGATGDPLPKQTCGVITLRTGVMGRAGRGRAYIPFPTEALNSGLGAPTAAYLTDLINLANLFIGPLTVPGTGGGNSIQVTGCLLHRASDTTDLLTGFVARQKWGTQRRRGDYGKQNALPF